MLAESKRCLYCIFFLGGIWGNEELRWEGQYRGILRGKKAVFRGEGLLIYTWIITEMNHPTQRYILHDDYDDMIYTLLLNPARGYC